MVRRHNLRRRALQCVLLLVLAAIFIIILLQNYTKASAADDSVQPVKTKTNSKASAGPCSMKRDCPEDHLSFFIQSGAANVVAPKICVKNNLVLGSAKSNAGPGINVVVINGKTGETMKTGHFNMYSGDVKPLIELLESIETGSAVLMASFDDPSTKLNVEARKLIADLGSSSVQSLGFRDNWVFVGGKGAVVKSSFEKFLKNDKAKNKYDNWPELIQLQGCIPGYLQ